MAKRKHTAHKRHDHSRLGVRENRSTAGRLGPKEPSQPHGVHHGRDSNRDPGNDTEVAGY